MRLSEAIRLGAMNKPQGFGWYDNGGTTCAMGAAMDAAGCQNKVFESAMLWPVLVESPASCPVCDLVVVGHALLFATGAIVVHLNDYHKWSREAIADFVASCEQRSDATRASAAVGMSVLQPVAVTART